MRTKPDDRRNNEDRLQHIIDYTIENFYLAEEDIEESDDENYKEALKEKNHKIKGS